MEGARALALYALAPSFQSELCSSQYSQWIGQHSILLPGFVQHIPFCLPAHQATLALVGLCAMGWCMCGHREAMCLSKDSRAGSTGLCCVSDCPGLGSVCTWMLGTATKRCFGGGLCFVMLIPFVLYHSFVASITGQIIHLTIIFIFILFFSRSLPVSHEHFPCLKFTMS